MTIQQREGVYAKYLALNPSATNKALAEKILTNHTTVQLGIAETTLVKHIGKWRKDLSDQLADEVLVDEDTLPIFFQEDDGPKWRITGENYFWETGRGDINLPVIMIDQLFYDYSEYGLNLTQTEVINKYNLKVWQWHSIKRVLELYKKSNIFSPWTVQNTPSEELNQLIEEKMKALTDNIGYQVVQKYNKAIIKKYKETLKDEAGKKLERDTLLMELQDIIPPAIKEIRPRLSIAPSESSRILTSFLFDIHYGAETRTRDEWKGVFSRSDRKAQEVAMLPDYSPEKCEAMLNSAAQSINAQGAEEVHLFFGGDNIETFTGLNHQDSWKGIAKGYYGAQLVKKSYEMLVRFISKVNNVKSIHAVPGNHDRATEKREQDGQGFIAEIIFELINLSFGKHIPVNYQEKVVSEFIDGIQYIMSHGHLKLTDVAASELVLKYGDPELFNLLLSGHWHTRKIKHDSAKFRSIVCSSLFPGNDYSVNGGWDSTPGFLMCYNDGNGKPRVIDVPL